MPAGASPKREREYKTLESRFRDEGRYKGREKEVASRIVNRQRSQYGETRQEKDNDRRGESPDRNLPIRDYQHLTVDQVTNRLHGLAAIDIDRIERYERQHKNRSSLLKKLRQVRGAS